MSELITVIIPCYNVENYIERTLESVIASSYQKLEIICVDDGSTDDTAIKIQEFSRKDDRIKLIKKSNNGVVEARRTALNLAKGNYISLVDADDWIASDAYEKSMDALIKHEVDITVWEFIATDGLNRNPLITYDKEEVISGKEAFLSCLDGWKLTGSGGVYKKSIYLKAYDKLDKYELKTYNADEFITRVAFSLATNILKVKTQYFYFHNNDSATRKMSKKWFGSIQTLLCVRNIIKEYSYQPKAEYLLLNELVRKLWWFKQLVRKKELDIGYRLEYLSEKKRVFNEYKTISFFKYMAFGGFSLKAIKLKCKLVLLLAS